MAWGLLTKPNLMAGPSLMPLRVSCIGANWPFGIFKSQCRLCLQRLVFSHSTSGPGIVPELPEPGTRATLEHPRDNHVYFTPLSHCLTPQREGLVTRVISLSCRLVVVSGTKMWECPTGKQGESAFVFL